jgi:hypothetical protein
MTPEIITTCIAVVALFVALLARVDSRKSANAAEKSAAEAKRANDLLERQLELATGELKRQVQNDIIESQPCIAWDESSAGPQSVTYKLKNHGGTMSNVAVICDEGFQAFISPKDVIAKGTEAEVRFICNVLPQPNPFKFSVETDDKFNQRRKINFSIFRRPDGYWEIPAVAQN